MKKSVLTALAILCLLLSACSSPGEQTGPASGISSGGSSGAGAADPGPPRAPSADEQAYFSGFTVEEIQSAMDAAGKYYKSIAMTPVSLQYDLANRIYQEYASKYEKDDLIAFTVRTKQPEDPPRGIVLIRKNPGGVWRVLDEGYLNKI